MPKSKTYFRFDNTVPRKKRRGRFLLGVVSVIFLLSGVYLLVMTQMPRLAKLPIKSSVDLNLDDDENDKRDRIQIQKINLEVPYFGDNTPAVLEKGAWWRFPERGNPKDGGNFIIAAHRFNLGYTPQGTRAKSPFYNLNELEPGDKLRIFYQNEWFEYEVTKNYSVAPSAIEIEEPSEEAKLTLYTCSLAGSVDGRVVVEAKPLFKTEIETETNESSIEGSPLL